MTNEEAIAKLHALDQKWRDTEVYDNESIHSNADGILLNFLVENGYADVAREWQRLRDKVGFWYA